MTEYVTPEHYERAEKNGISRKLVNNRFYDNGWDIERAITQPVRKLIEDQEYRKWIEIAAKNGIRKETFWQRVYKSGWSYEYSATRPSKRTGPKSKLPITKEQYDQGAKLGLSKHLVRKRLYEGWSLEKAITTPKMSKEETIKRATEAAALKRRSGAS